MEKQDRKVWTEEVNLIQEDEILTHLIEIHGEKAWTIVSKELKKTHNFIKTGKQCRERWNNNLSPNITKDNWTAQEEKILFDMHKVHGNKWSVIAAEIKGRTDNSTKNHFYSIVRKNLRRFNKTQPSHKKINGNLQELLVDPEISKILLKKPRHYTRKNSNKKNSSKDLKPVIDLNLTKKTMNNSLKTKQKATINIRRSSTDSLKPLNLSGSTTSSRRQSMKYEDLTLDSHFLMPMNFDVPSNNLNSFEFISPKNLHDPLNVSPMNYSMSSCRSSNRSFSFKSVEGVNFSRKSSRNNTNESCIVRSDSRKNSQNSSSGKSFYEEGNSEYRRKMLANPEVLPEYSLMDTFQFKRSP
jgi:hypothetical protein